MPVPQTMHITSSAPRPAPASEVRATDLSVAQYKVALAELRVDPHVQADETSFRTQIRSERSFVWTFLSELYTVYVYSSSRAGDTAKKGERFLQGFVKLFIEKDASLAEINPLIVTEKGDVLALDCKLNFDDNAMFRHRDIAAMLDVAEEDPSELRAGKLAPDAALDPQELYFIRVRADVSLNGINSWIARYSGEAAESDWVQSPLLTPTRRQ